MGPSVTEMLLRTTINNQEEELSSFLQKHNEGQWILAADFCLDDNDYYNNTCAITILPLNEDPRDISERIAKAIPKDIKKTQSIDPSTLELLRSEEVFHFVFLLEGHRGAIGAASEDSRLQANREYVQKMVSDLIAAGCPPVNLKPFKRLLEASKAKSFNFRLMADLVAISSLLAFVAALLVRNGAIAVWLFPDRDKITEWCDGVYSDLVQNYISGVLSVVDEKVYDCEIKRAIPSPADGKNSWIDSFVRMPAYMAGVVAGWNIENNLITSEKREIIFINNIVDSKNVILLRLCFDKGLSIEKIAVSRKAQT